MSLFTIAFQGSTPIVAPIVGFIGQHAGARYSVAVGGVASLLAGIYGLINAAKRRAARLAEARPVDGAVDLLPGRSVTGSSNGQQTL